MGPKSKTEAFIRSHVSHSGDDCLIWPFGRDGQGYARAKVKGYNTRLAHRIMCSMANGRSPFSGAVVRHICGMGHKGCVNPRHLAWGTVAENNADKEIHGSKPIGEKVGRSVLTSEKVLEIRSLSNNGFSQRKIAKRMNVCAGTIQAILEGRTWGHVP